MLNKAMFNTLSADFKRHGSVIFYPPFWAICNYRFGRWAFTIRFPPLRWLASKMYGLNQFIILITSGIELNRETKIGTALHLIHCGNIRIHPGTIIGDRCGILHDVTIGTNMNSGAPMIGNDVFIGAGAKVLGDITIGDNVMIAANSLVTVNVPSGCVAVGVPAKIIRRRKIHTQIKKQQPGSDH
jgi:serine O-acetyltransferase